MNVQFIMFVWSALLVGSLVNSGAMWTTYTQCYECDGVFNVSAREYCIDKATISPTTRCEAPVGYYAWCKKVIHRYYDPTLNTENRPLVTKSCHISRRYDDKERCFSAFNVETCYCHSDLCN